MIAVSTKMFQQVVDLELKSKTYPAQTVVNMIPLYIHSFDRQVVTHHMRGIHPSTHEGLKIQHHEFFVQKHDERFWSSVPAIEHEQIQKWNLYDHIFSKLEPMVQIKLQQRWTDVWTLSKQTTKTHTFKFCTHFAMSKNNESIAATFF